MHPDGRESCQGDSSLFYWLALFEDLDFPKILAIAILLQARRQKFYGFESGYPLKQINPVGTGLFRLLLTIQ
jgi:hypothetical protein